MRVPVSGLAADELFARVTRSLARSEFSAACSMIDLPTVRRAENEWHPPTGTTAVHPLTLIRRLIGVSVTGPPRECHVC